MMQIKQKLIEEINQTSDDILSEVLDFLLDVAVLPFPFSDPSQTITNSLCFSLRLCPKGLASRPTLRELKQI